MANMTIEEEKELIRTLAKEETPQISISKLNKVMSKLNEDQLIALEVKILYQKVKTNKELIELKKRILKEGTLSEYK